MHRFNVCSWSRLGSALVLVCGNLVQPGQATAATPSPADAAPYLAAVRRFADQVLAHGRDVYGRPTPLFVDGLNVDTGEPVKWKWADGKEWVLCNFANQQGLLRTLDGLSQLTGEPRYKEAALEATRYAFDHLRYGTENNGGLLAWGGHLAYNATDDVLAGNPGGVGRIHELKCFFPHYADDFKGHRVVEGTLFPCYGDTPQTEPQAARLLLGAALGEPGRDFTRQAVEELTAWGKSAYRAKDNTFIPMLTDGTSMEGYVCKKDGYFGPKGRVLRAGHPRAEHLWLYAFAFRLSGDTFLWEMARHMAQGNGWGDIGESPKASPKILLPDNLSDPRLLMALLELHRASGQAGFLNQAEVVGRNILKQQVHNGWFVPSQRHVFCRVANDESQALLHLAAALMDKPEAVPAFTGAQPFFHAEYGTSTGRVYDSADVYGKTR